jgi:hypothetical protein
MKTTSHFIIQEKKNLETSIGGADIVHTITMNRFHGLCLEMMMLAVRERVFALSATNIALASDKRG